MNLPCNPLALEIFCPLSLPRDNSSKIKREGAGRRRRTDKNRVRIPRDKNDELIFLVPGVVGDKTRGRRVCGYEGRNDGGTKDFSP